MSTIPIPEETKKVIYLISDDADISTTPGDEYSELRVQLRHCNSYQDALKKMNQEMDLIFSLVLDWDMNIEKTTQFVREIKGSPRWHHIPLMMLTNQVDEYKVRQGIGMGVVYYLDKRHWPRESHPIMAKVIKDFNYYLYYIEKIKNSRLTALAQSGTFKFRTFKEGYEVADWLANICKSSREDIVVGFIELIINAIEHGNIQIGYEQKTTLLKRGDYINTLVKMIDQPEHQDKHIVVKFEKLPDRVDVTIEDEGAGFDFGKYLHIDKSRFFDTHGRGIAMSKNIYFDQLEFIGKGNIVKVSVFNKKS